MNELYSPEVYEYLGLVLTGDKAAQEEKRWKVFCLEEKLVEPYYPYELGEESITEDEYYAARILRVTAKGEKALWKYQQAKGELVVPMRQQPAVDDSEWLKQIEVARRLRLPSMNIQRLCNDGILQTNGQPGKAKRIKLSSVINYCHNEGIAYNDNAT